MGLKTIKLYNNLVVWFFWVDLLIWVGSFIYIDIYFELVSSLSERLLNDFIKAGYRKLKLNNYLNPFYII